MAIKEYVHVTFDEINPEFVVEGEVFDYASICENNLLEHKDKNEKHNNIVKIYPRSEELKYIIQYKYNRIHFKKYN